MKKGAGAYSLRDMLMKKKLLFYVSIILPLALCLVLSSCSGIDKSRDTAKSALSTKEADNTSTEAEPSSIPEIPTQMPSDTSDSDTPTSSDIPTSSDSSSDTEMPPSPPDTPSTGADGTLRSQSGTSLNLVMHYTFINTSGKNTVKLEIGLDTYALSVSARTNTITVDGKEYKYNSDAIAYTGASKTYIKLFEGTFDIEGNSGKLPIKAEWSFKGEYAGQKIDKLTIDSVINY